MSVRSLLVGLVICVGFFQCRDTQVYSPTDILDTIAVACKKKDAGEVMNLVDLHYQDALGGPGQLENDLRQLFAVHGGLRIKVKDELSFHEEEIRGRVTIEGKRMKFEGPISLLTSRWPSGILIRSGMFTDLRGILVALRERRIALENRSCDRLVKVVSPKYSGKTGSREKLIEKLDTGFKAVKTQAMLLDKVNILIDHTEAQVVQSFLLITHIGKLKEENQSRERLMLSKEGSSWRFTGGLG